MTNKQFSLFKEKIDKEIKEYTLYNLNNKTNAAIFDNCREIYTIHTIYDYLSQYGKKYNLYLLPDKDILKTFENYIHRMGLTISDNSIKKVINFYYEDNKVEYLLKGRLYTPIRFGDEDSDWGGKDDDHPTCGDCGCEVGDLHLPNCDIERCPSCGLQFLSCDCGVAYRIGKEERKLLPLLIEKQKEENIRLQKEFDDLMKKLNQENKKEKSKRKSDAEM